LVGSSGTGKSYKALQLANDKRIEYIIDDGLLISRSKKIGGSSAKREATRLTAVKRAIFHFEEHRNEMKQHLIEENPERLLLIGTSEKMVRQIADNLGIAPIDEIFWIEDISTPEEIEIALDIRKREGKHVIPLPTVEVKKDFSGYFRERLRVLIHRRGSSGSVAEKTIVRPTFSYIGKYSISVKAIHQIMAFSLSEHLSVERMIKGRVIEEEDGIRLLCDLLMNNSERLTRVAPKLQSIVKEAVEDMTGLYVKTVDIHINKINVL
jgi:hypothetical protein